MTASAAITDRGYKGRRPPPGRSPAGSRLHGVPAARAGDAWALGPHRLVCGGRLDPAAFLAIDAAIRRWQAATGESARLHPKGETFASILRARRRSTTVVFRTPWGRVGGGRAMLRLSRGSLNRKIQRDPPPQPAPTRGAGERDGRCANGENAGGAQ